MDNKKLFRIPYPERMNQKELSDAIRDWFKKNGTIAFEHGFKRTIVNDGVKWDVVLALPHGLELKNHRFSLSRYAPYSQLPKQTLLRIMGICEDYYKYCLEEA